MVMLVLMVMMVLYISNAGNDGIVSNDGNAGINGNDGIVGTVINPRRACAARVTVLGLCVCLLPRFLPPHATMRPTRYTSGFSGT